MSEAVETGDLDRLTRACDKYLALARGAGPLAL